MSTPTTSPTAPAALGRYVHGTGYSYSLPQGWRDFSDSSEAVDLQADTVSADGALPSISQAAVLVTVLPAEGKRAKQLLSQTGYNYRTQMKADVDFLPSRRVGGMTMLRLAATYTFGGVERIQKSHIAVQDGTCYSIVTSRSTSAGELDPDLKEVLESWAWE